MKEQRDMMCLEKHNSFIEADSDLKELYIEFQKQMTATDRKRSAMQQNADRPGN